MQLKDLIQVIPNGKRVLFMRGRDELITLRLERVVEGSSPRRRSIKTIVGTEDELLLIRCGIKVSDNVNAAAFVPSAGHDIVIYMEDIQP